MIIAIVTYGGETKAYILRDLQEVNRLRGILTDAEWEKARIFYYPNYLFPEG